MEKIYKKILVISTFPIAEPQHGGQKRTAAIMKTYNRLFSEAKHIAVYRAEDYETVGENDIAVQDPAVINDIKAFPLASDFTIGQAVYKDKAVKKHLQKFINNFQPDIIQVEQIYPFAGLKLLLQEMGKNPKIVLSSHNVEYLLKKEVFKNAGIDEKDKKIWSERIKALEIEVSRRADLVIAVSKADAEMHRSMGAKKCLVVLNGIDKTLPTAAALEHWQKFKREKNVKYLVTFVGSAHPPNLYGLETMVGRDLEFLPSGAHLMVAGGISNYIQGVYSGHRSAKKFWSKASPLGRLSDDNLAGLLEETEVLILPITSGGGSNLKTAEAILYDRKTVATSYAFRSYEKYVNLPNIFIANTPEEFRGAINKAIKTPYAIRSSDENNLAEQVQWKYCLRPLEDSIEVLIYGRLRLITEKVQRVLKAQSRKLLPKF